MVKTLMTLCLTLLCNTSKLFIITNTFVCKWTIKLNVKNLKTYQITKKARQVEELNSLLFIKNMLQLFYVLYVLALGGFTMKEKAIFILASSIVFTFASLLIYQAGYLKGYQTGYTNQAQVSAKKNDYQL